MTFAEALHSEKERLGLSQRAMADRLGVSPRTVWNWLAGRRVPPQITQDGALAKLREEER